MKIDRQSPLWISIMNGLMIGYKYTQADHLVTWTDKVYSDMLTKINKENEESNSQPVAAIPPQDKSVNKELFDALEMTWAYLSQLVNDGYKLPNIDIVQGSNTAALNYAKEVMENE